MIRKHDLHHEFPNRDEQIHNLKVGNNHFRKLFDDYHDVNEEIHRIEMGNEVVIDEYLTQLRKKRLLLKDELYAIMLDDEKSNA